MENKLKVYYKSHKWRLGRSYGWWDVPFCPHCKRQLGLLCADSKPEECPMCHNKLDWRE